MPVAKEKDEERLLNGMAMVVASSDEIFGGFRFGREPFSAHGT